MQNEWHHGPRRKQLHMGITTKCATGNTVWRAVPGGWPCAFIYLTNAESPRALSSIWWQWCWGRFVLGLEEPCSGLRAEADTCWNIPPWSASLHGQSLPHSAPVGSACLCPQWGLPHLSQLQARGPHSVVYAHTQDSWLSAEREAELQPSILFSAQIWGETSMFISQILKCETSEHTHLCFYCFFFFFSYPKTTILAILQGNLSRKKKILLKFQLTNYRAWIGGLLSAFRRWIKCSFHAYISLKYQMYYYGLEAQLSGRVCLACAQPAWVPSLALQINAKRSKARQANKTKNEFSTNDKR